MAEAAVGAAPQLASQTLDAALREVVTSLNEARMALEAFVDKADNVQLLQRCRSELAQVQGVLRVMEIHGAAQVHGASRIEMLSAGRQPRDALGAAARRGLGQAEARHRLAQGSRQQRQLCHGFGSVAGGVGGLRADLAQHLHVARHALR
jgi:exonuclease VII small subunit